MRRILTERLAQSVKLDYDVTIDPAEMKCI